jgi:hypothetical protein
VISSSAETGRSVYQIGVAVSDTKQAQDVIAGIFCQTLITQDPARFHGGA